MKTLPRHHGRIGMRGIMNLFKLRIPKDKYNDYLIKLEFINLVRYLGYSSLKFLTIDLLGYSKSGKTFYVVLLNFKLSFSLAGKKRFNK